MNIIIEKEFISKKTHTIIKNSKEESKFVEDFIRKFRSFNTVNITDKYSFKSIVQEYTDIVESIWKLYC